MEETLVNHEVVDSGGGKVGKITDVISDPATLEPAWYTVKTGKLGREHLVPAAVVHQHDGRIVVDCDKETVKAAPAAADHTAPTTEERERLARHYGLNC